MEGLYIFQAPAFEVDMLFNGTDSGNNLGLSSLSFLPDAYAESHKSFEEFRYRHF